MNKYEKVVVVKPMQNYNNINSTTNFPNKEGKILLGF